MNKMMKSSISSSGNNKKGTFRRTLSGRENPARPMLSEDEGAGNERVESDVAITTSGSTGVPKESNPGESRVNKRPSLAVAKAFNGSLSGQGGSGTSKTRKTTGSKSETTSNSASQSDKMLSSERGSGTSKTSKKSEYISNSASQSDKNKSRKKGAANAKDKLSTRVDANKPYLQKYDDPEVARVLSDSDNDADDIEPIVGNYIPLNDSRPPPVIDQNSRPPLSLEVDPSVEVVSTMVTPTFLGRGAQGQTSLITMESIDGPVGVQIISPSSSSSVKDADDGEVDYHVAGTTSLLEYRSPQRSFLASKLSSKNDSPLSSLQDSPDSRMSGMSVIGNVSGNIGDSSQSRTSSSNSRSTSNTISSADRTIHTPQQSRGDNSSVVDGVDYEVKEANRQSMSIRRSLEAGMHNTIEGSSQEIAIDADGAATVFSSSTSSSAYHSYFLPSPRPLRDGATMMADQFFPSGNVAWSPSPAARAQSSQSTATVDSVSGISRFLTLSPKPGRKSAIGTSGQEAMNSPHTISSNSCATSTSSGSDTKKPLKFVEYPGMQTEEGESSLDGPPVGSSDGGGRVSEPGLHFNSSIYSLSTVIKPRIFIKGHACASRPPIQARASTNKPSQSPRKQDPRLSGTRTSTRSPPPSVYHDSGSTTPLSPPAIIDGLNVIVEGVHSRGRISKRPIVVRHTPSGPKMFLVPPSGARGR